MLKTTYSESTRGSVLTLSIFSYIRSLSITHLQFWPNDLSYGSYEVIWGRTHFLSLTFDRIKIDRALEMVPMCSFRRDESTDLQHDHLVHHVTSHDLYLRSNSDLDILSSTCIPMFRRTLTKKTRWRSPHFFCSKFIREKLYGNLMLTRHLRSSLNKVLNLVPLPSSCHEQHVPFLREALVQ